MRKLIETFIPTILVGFFIFLSFASGESRKSEGVSTSNEKETSTYQKQINEEPEKKLCYKCKGEGVITCGMCGGSGTNNMGMVCGCVTYVENCRTLGRKPTRTALQWTCEHCKGIGYEP